MRSGSSGDGVEGRHGGHAVLQPGDELVEAQLLEPAADGVELGRAELDEPAALADEVERLAQPGVAGVQPPDDLLEAGGRGLVGLGLGRPARSCLVLGQGGIDGGVGEEQPHRAGPRAASALVTTLPSRSSTTA